MKLINEQISPDLVRQVRKLARYKDLLSRILPVECRNHVEVANIRNQNLMLLTDSPVWTTRLRQLCPQLLDYIHKNDINNNSLQIIHHIQISTRFHQTSAENQPHAPSSKNRSQPQISSKTSKLLSQSADSISHPPLREALLKIARHAADKSDTES